MVFCVDSPPKKLKNRMCISRLNKKIRNTERRRREKGIRQPCVTPWELGLTSSCLVSYVLAKKHFLFLNHIST
jgi:hypothetical protein